MQGLLDEVEDRAEDEEEDDEEWGTLFSKPVAEQGVSSMSSTGHHERVRIHDQRGGDHDEDIEQEVESTEDTPATNSTVLPTTTTASPPTATTPPTSTLRHRHNNAHEPPSTTSAKATGASTSSPQPDERAAAEQELSSHRLEQEDLTSSLLSLAGQLKASSQSFQTTLENEKSVLDRAVQGIDKTSTTMEAAGKRMGMLRRMTEGKGWWGRMMLYAWIFGLWVVAVLIVFVGPKLRF